MNNALEIKNLQKNFNGVHALDHLSFVIKKELITSVIGPNGSGKSTLVNVMTGVHAIDGGMVKIGNTEIAHIQSPDVSTYGVTRTFQEVRLLNQMTVLDNILVVLTERSPFLALFERHKKFHLARVEELLKSVNLWEKRAELAGNCSYGQRKLLEVVRALAMGAEIYFFDEPFAGLFPEMRKIIIQIIKDLKIKGKTVILIEHNMDLIRELSDWVIVLDSGKLLAEGEADEVLRRKDVIEAYLGE